MEEEKTMAEVQKSSVDVEREPEKVFCVKCGAEILDGQAFCPKCGHKVGAKLEAESGTDKTARSAAGNKKVKIIIGAIAVVAIALVAVIAIRGTQAKSVTLSKDFVTVKVGETISLSFTIDPDNTKDKTVTWTSSNESIAMVTDDMISGINEGDCVITVKTKNGKTDTCEVTVLPAGPDLQAIYNEYCTSTFASIASDGSYLYVDTNPSDEDDSMDYEAYLAIVSINDALELPESVLNKMNQTRSMDGIQSYSTDDLEITWIYHPDKGLEISYSLK